MSTHHRAWCRRCRAAWTGADAHRNARRHTLTHAATDTPHPTETRQHPRQFCTPECRAEKETQP